MQSASKPQVTGSTTFRIPGKPITATGSTAITSPSPPSSSSMLRMQLSTPLTSSSATKFSQAPNILTQLKQQQQQGLMDQASKSGSNRNMNNNVRLFSGLGKQGLN